MKTKILYMAIAISTLDMYFIVGMIVIRLIRPNPTEPDKKYMHGRVRVSWMSSRELGI